MKTEAAVTYGALALMKQEHQPDKRFSFTKKAKGKKDKKNKKGKKKKKN